MSSIAKNASYMTIASVGQKMIAFVYFAIIARMLGPAQQGIYTTAMTFTTIMVVFVDLGFTNVLVREVAKAKDKAQEYLSTLLAVKIGLGIITYLATVMIVNILGYDDLLKLLIYVSAITMLFDSCHVTLYGVMRGFGTLRYEALMIFGSQLITLLFGSLFLFLKLPLVSLVLAFTIPGAINVIFAAVVLSKKFGIHFRPSFHKTAFFHLGKIAIPFAIAAVFARIYSYIDTILLERLMDATAAGWYAVPYKITFAFQFIPLALVAALYPKFSEYYAHNRQKLAYIFERGSKYLLLLAFPIAVGIGVLAPDIIGVIFGDTYAASVLPLQILIVSLIFSFISFPIGAFLNACDKQSTQTGIVAIVMVVNIVMNIILIPTYGPVGAAIAALTGNILLTVLGYLIMPHIAKISHIFIAKTVGQVSIAAGIMGLIVYYSNLHVHFTLSIMLGIVSYAILIYIFRIVTTSQLREAFSLVKK